MEVQALNLIRHPADKTREAAQAGETGQAHNTVEKPRLWPVVLETLGLGVFLASILVFVQLLSSAAQGLLF